MSHKKSASPFDGGIRIFTEGAWWVNWSPKSENKIRWRHWRIAHRESQEAWKAWQYSSPFIIIENTSLMTTISLGASSVFRDAVAKSIGVDDGDPAIKFQYEQSETKGREGVIVMIERL